MYKVIEYFEDLQNDNKAYNVGDVFPAEGFSVSRERIEELASDKNRRKKPLIREIQEKPKKKKAKPEEFTE